MAEGGGGCRGGNGNKRELKTNKVGVNEVSQSCLFS